MPKHDTEDHREGEREYLQRRGRVEQAAGRSAQLFELDAAGQGEPVAGGEDADVVVAGPCHGVGERLGLRHGRRLRVHVEDRERRFRLDLEAIGVVGEEDVVCAALVVGFDQRRRNALGDVGGGGEAARVDPGSRRDPFEDRRARQHVADKARSPGHRFEGGRVDVMALLLRQVDQNVGDGGARLQFPHRDFRRQHADAADARDRRQQGDGGADGGKGEQPAPASDLWGRVIHLRKDTASTRAASYRGTSRMGRVFLVGEN